MSFGSGWVKESLVQASSWGHNPREHTVGTGRALAYNKDRRITLVGGEIRCYDSVLASEMVSRLEFLTPVDVR